METSLSAPCSKSVQLFSSSDLDQQLPLNQIDYLKKNITTLANYFDLGQKECENLWLTKNKLYPKSILTIVSFDSSKHLLGETKNLENWITFRVGAVEKMHQLYNNPSKPDNLFTFIEESEDSITLIELDDFTLFTTITKEFPGIFNSRTQFNNQSELFIKTLCKNISFLSLIPLKRFTRCLRIFY